MKKKVFIILLCGVLLLGLAGCGKDKNKFDIGNKSNIEITKQDVVMSIKEGTLTNMGATIILTNNSDKNFQYGMPYEIEIKKEGEWYKIDAELNFNLPAFALKAHETTELELNWEDAYGALATGTYRIIKNIGYKEEGEYKSFPVSVEFNMDSD